MQILLAWLLWNHVDPGHFLLSYEAQWPWRWMCFESLDGNYNFLLSFSFSQLNWRSSWMCGGDRGPLMVKIIYNFYPHQHLNNKHVKQLKFTTFLHISCLCIGMAAWGSIRSFYYHLFDIELFSKQDDKRWTHCGPFSTVTGGHFKAVAASLSEWKLTGQRVGGSGSKTPSFAPFWLFWSVT